MRPTTLSRDRETGVFRLYAWAIIISTGLAVGAALLGTRSAPTYSARAEILIGPTITPSGNYIAPSMPTEQRVATSAEVVNSTAAKLGVSARQALAHLSVTVPVDTEVLVMTYTDSSPAAALAGARAFSQTYLRARNPEDGKNPVASLVSPPELPSSPVGKNYPVILGAAVLGGVLAGFVAARAWDRVRGRIRTVADAERTADLDALALTPQLPRTSIGHDPRLLDGRTQLDSLAARVLGEADRGPESSVLVTGAGTDCGSTAVAVLTALSLARMGRVVVLVTADAEVVARMSRDRGADRGPTKSSPDLWPDARAARQDGLHLVSVPEWDGAGIAAGRLTNLLPELHERLPEALIVVDGPPAWSSAGIALRVDKILLVVALGRGSRAATALAVQSLDHCADKLMGLVVTPRRGHAPRELVPVRRWASRQAKRVVFRVAPPAIGLAPTIRSVPGTTTDGPIRVEKSRRPAARAGGAGAGTPVGRRPKPRPNGEPSSSTVLS